MKTLKKIIIFLIIIALLIVIAYFAYRFYLKKEFASIPVIEKSASFGEYADITSGNLKIAISSINYDKENNKLNYTMDFSTVDEKGLSSYIVYDYLIYDADKNIIANNSLSISTPAKKKFFLGFAATNYNSISFKSISDRYIGVVNGGNIISDIGTVKQSFEVADLDSISNLKTLTIRLTNVQYKELEQTETIMPNTDFVFTFNQ